MGDILSNPYHFCRDRIWQALVISNGIVVQKRNTIGLIPGTLPKSDESEVIIPGLRPCKIATTGMLRIGVRQHSRATSCLAHQVKHPRTEYYRHGYSSISTTLLPDQILGVSTIVKVSRFPLGFMMFWNAWKAMAQSQMGVRERDSRSTMSSSSIPSASP